jgi:hypothetical protein
MGFYFYVSLSLETRANVRRVKKIDARCVFFFLTQTKIVAKIKTLEMESQMADQTRLVDAINAFCVVLLANDELLNDDVQNAIDPIVENLLPDNEIAGSARYSLYSGLNYVADSCTELKTYERDVEFIWSATLAEIQRALKTYRHATR